MTNHCNLTQILGTFVVSSLVVLATVSGCAQKTPHAHYRSRLPADAYCSSCQGTGQVIPKLGGPHACRYPVELPFYGYHATCWQPWPEGWIGCPEIIEVIEVAEQDSAPVSPSSEPAPMEPAPTEPTPMEPAPMEPTPTEPTPVELTPTEPTPVELTPTEPTPLEPTPPTVPRQTQQVPIPEPPAKEAPQSGVDQESKRRTSSRRTVNSDESASEHRVEAIREETKQTPKPALHDAAMNIWRLPQIPLPKGDSKDSNDAVEVPRGMAKLVRFRLVESKDDVVSNRGKPENMAETESPSALEQSRSDVSNPAQSTLRVKTASVTDTTSSPVGVSVAYDADDITAPVVSPHSDLLRSAVGGKKQDRQIQPRVALKFKTPNS